MWNQTIAAAIDEVMQEARDTGLFVSVCSFYQPSGNYTEGAPDGLYVIVPALANIACMNAPISIMAPTATEDKTIDHTLSTNDNHLLLDDNYDAVPWTGTDGNSYFGPQTQMRAYITDANGILTIYDIAGIEEDSQSTQTRLKIRLASV